MPPSLRPTHLPPPVKIPYLCLRPLLPACSPVGFTCVGNDLPDLATVVPCPDSECCIATGCFRCRCICGISRCVALPRAAVGPQRDSHTAFLSSWAPLPLPCRCGRP